MFCFFIKVSQAILPNNVLPHTRVDHPGLYWSGYKQGVPHSREERE